MSTLKVLGLAVLLACATLIHAQTVVINGKTVPVKTLVQNGKPLVDALALLRALGINARWDAKAKKLIILTPGAMAPSTLSVPQLPGEWGELNVAYKLGTADPLIFALTGAEYTATRVRFGDAWVAPKAEEKLLVLHYTLQNPQPKDLYVNWTAIGFVAVDEADQNHEPVENAGVEGSKEKLDFYLKPSQKIEAYTVIVIPAGGSVPKLIVQPNEGAVVRFDLRKKVKPLPAPISDARDGSGATALGEVPAPAGLYYPMGVFDVQLTGAAFAGEGVGNQEPGAGNRFLVGTLKIRNATPAAQELKWDNLLLELRTAAGRTITWNQILLQDKSDEVVEQQLRPGDEVSVRVFFEVPAGENAKTLRISEQDSRAYLFNMSGVK